MDAPSGGSAPGDGAPGNAPGAGSTKDSPQDGGQDGGRRADAELVVDVLHRVGRCPLSALLAQPELTEWTTVRLEQAVVRAWSGGLVFIDRNDDLVAL